MNLRELREYQVEFEKVRGEVASDFKSINDLRKKFTLDYSINKLLTLKKEEYAVGLGESTFCNRIENELNEWGNIHGSPATKFGIYFGKFGEDKSRKYRVGRKEYGDNVDLAFKKIIDSIIMLVEKRDDIEVLKNIPISPMFKGKILSVYYPDDFMNIFSAKHLNHFIDSLCIENSSKSELDKQALLLHYKNSDQVMKKWSVYEFSRFLYKSFGSPNDEVKEEKLPDELKEFKGKDFPPIETVNFSYVELTTDELPERNDRKERKGRKIDYINRSEKLKKIGNRGELIVLKAERNYLKKNGKPDLEKLVEYIAEKDDSAGYDIKSYNLDGTERLIEVKSTTQGVGSNNIYISANELDVANKNSNYYFYLVYEADSKIPKIWRVKGTDLLNDKKIIKEPIAYRLRINAS
ncbi:DUF3883 domain-containing protein [Vibrio cholerae]